MTRVLLAATFLLASCSTNPPPSDDWARITPVIKRQIGR